MIQRSLKTVVERALQQYPVVTLTGPRQSGKTTLARSMFPNFEYYSLEDPDVRQRAQTDPRAFLDQVKTSVILDEIQRTPDLTSYIQGIVDSPDNHRKFVLTGSRQLLLMEAVSQSLAGRTRVFELLPFSLSEIFNQIKSENLTIHDVLFRGGYPRIWDKSLSPTEWHKEYFRLYVERDIRSIVKIMDLDKFELFMRLSAGRIGQLLNLNSLGNEAGVTQPTAESWLSAMKTTFIAFTLQPHFINFNKRIVKTPKLYFYDTGLLCYLLGIIEAKQLEVHPLRGLIFENFVVAELIKREHHLGREPRYYFWRDQKGHEVDLLRDDSTTLYPIEIKMAQTFQPSFIDHLNHFNSLQKNKVTPLGSVYCCVDKSFDYQGYKIQNWTDLAL
ncbi:MAG: ATP-binding protein [Pseudobdellovibrionaceae bacterium]|nr:ATP-binding protein [Bdellovibrionales bacterium]USN46695.1 MAG: ATP-binding protein [Pseudobdellovibrionaceae bacterium]